MAKTTWARAPLGLAIALMSPLCIVRSASAVDVVGTEARMRWSPSEGPVSSYLVFASLNGGEQTSYDLRPADDPQTLVRGAVGDSFQIWVQAVDAGGNASPLSPPSEIVRFVDAAPDPGSSPPGGNDSPTDPDGGGPPDEPPPDPPPPQEEPAGEPDPDAPPGDPAAIPGAPFDFDGDGRAELLVRLADGTLEIWNPARERPEVEATSPGRLGSNEAVMGADDYDGDGYADLAIVGPGGLAVHLLGRRTLPEVVRLPYDAGGSVVGSGDFDGDGGADLVVTSRRSVEVWLRLGSGPRNERLAELPDGAPVGVPDADGDGDADLLFADRSLDLWLFEDGSRTGAVSRIAGVDGPEDVLAICELDGDGRDGVLLRSRNALLRVDLVEEVTRALGGSSFLLALPLFSSGDFDGDGDCDVAVVDPWDGGVTLLFLEGASVVDERPLATLPPGASAVRAVGEGL